MNPYRSNNPELTLMRLTDRTDFRARVRAKLKELSGNVKAAAKALGVDRRTLTRWLEEDRELRLFVRSLRKKGAN